jgi:putative membrane protein
MIRAVMLSGVLAFSTAAVAQTAGPTDPQIAHIAYTAGEIDITAAKQALAKSKDGNVRAFAEGMIRDHSTVNDKALALVKTLGVTPEANPTSGALSQQATQKLQQLAKLKGHAFDRAYMKNEVAYHQTVNSALRDTLIPNADNPQLKGLLETGLKLFQQHQLHAEQLVKSLRGRESASEGNDMHMPPPTPTY